MIADYVVWVPTGKILPVKIGRDEENLDQLPVDM
jgi:hypothetical protein